jgi:plasmid stabilization system protein ParE
MKIRVLRSAISDLEAGWQFYERQGSGLGDYFFDSLFSDIDALALHGGVHRVVPGFHRALSKRFPYAIYYRLVQGEVLVFRVLDCRRYPKRIAGELEDTD